MLYFACMLHCLTVWLALQAGAPIYAVWPCTGPQSGSSSWSPRRRAADRHTPSRSRSPEIRAAACGGQQGTQHTAVHYGHAGGENQYLYVGSLGVAKHAGARGSKSQPAATTLNSIPAYGLYGRLLSGKRSAPTAVTCRMQSMASSSTCM